MKTIINTLVVACVLGFCGVSRADEVSDAAAKLAAAKAAAAKKAAEERAAKAAVESVRRSQRSYSEFISENARAAWQTTKAGAAAGAGVVASADGYVGYAVAAPAVYATDAAFKGANASWAASTAAWNAPVANTK